MLANVKKGVSSLFVFLVNLGRILRTLFTFPFWARLLKTFPQFFPGRPLFLLRARVGFTGGHVWLLESILLPQ